MADASRPIAEDIPEFAASEVICGGTETIAAPAKGAWLQRLQEHKLNEPGCDPVERIAR